MEYPWSSTSKSWTQEQHSEPTGLRTQLSWSMPVTYSSGKALYRQIWIFFKCTTQVVSRCYHVIAKDWVLLQDIGDIELSLLWHNQKLKIQACAKVEATYSLSFRRALPALGPVFFGCPRSLQPQRVTWGKKASQLSNSDKLIGWVEIEKSCSICSLKIQIYNHSMMTVILLTIFAQ